MGLINQTHGCSALGLFGAVTPSSDEQVADVHGLDKRRAAVRPSAMKGSLAKVRHPHLSAGRAAE